MTKLFNFQLLEEPFEKANMTKVSDAKNVGKYGEKQMLDSFLLFYYCVLSKRMRNLKYLWVFFFELQTDLSK